MARKRHSDEDVLKLLREIELKLTSGDDVASACRSVGISDATYYNWKSRYGGLEASDLKRRRELEAENSQLKRLYAELSLENASLKDLISKKL